MEETFYPCNDREAAILTSLTGDGLAEYKRLRHAGATVTEAIDAVDPHEAEICRGCGRLHRTCQSSAMCGKTLRGR